ncbi:beta-lactamase [Colletotrichum orchidophilum]|uniref:Beta-lactamase n=1 Tax=Colletotrichum orchidophilum TaxID=1209926 RepID=A0A1G4BTA4_9PEZI|nr:beta-lactamase [Colletotrichum orchidophilum]OHF04575.1 beta-lactamase [Colletotrichum orchidophilum]
MGSIAFDCGSTADTPTIPAMEAAFTAAVKSGKIPGAVVMAKNTTGTIDYARCFGARTVRRDETRRLPPMEEDTPMRFASATKLLTSIMALQCVDRGLFGLDENVEKIIPDLTCMKVLAGFDDAGNTIMRDREGIITLRHLLTHTSGLSYVLINPLLQQYMSKGYLPAADKFGIQSRLAPPPVNDPGVEWMYGSNLDWAGRLVERATGMDLESYMQENLCDPLDIIDMTFKLQQRPDLLARRADQTQRSREDGKLVYDDTIYFRQDGEECFGGQGIFTSPESYMKVLFSLLKNDGVLLKPDTVKLMFQPALDARLEKQMNAHMDSATHINFGGPMPMTGLRRNFGLGGIIPMEDLDGDKWRRKGSMTLGGGPNIIWQIDPAAGLCTLVTYQLEPWNDPICRGLTQTFEKAIYASLPK